MSGLVSRAVAIVGGCLLAVTFTVPSLAAEKVILALPTLSLTFSAAYVAEALKLYEKEGLDVQVPPISQVSVRSIP